MDISFFPSEESCVVSLIVSGDAQISTYLAPFLGGENVAPMAEKFLEQSLRDVEARQSLVEDFWRDDSEHEELCACEFSLAYGGMILLNNTRFVLKRGKRYGLCGPNGCGKSTLMRSIAEGKVDGFPPKEVSPLLKGRLLLQWGYVLRQECELGRLHCCLAMDHVCLS
jgi:translation initiation factor RLI1